MEYTKENIIKLIQCMQDYRLKRAEAETDEKIKNMLYYCSNTLGQVMLMLEHETYFRDFCNIYRDDLIKD